jgi:IS30 family transposase
MDGQYDQLSLEDRCAIAALHAESRSIRQIASTLDRLPSAISRELKRNSGRQVGYKPAYAQTQTKAPRWKGARLERDTEPRERRGPWMTEAQLE